MVEFWRHHRGIDFLVEMEEIPGSTMVYRAKPVIEDLDPKLTVIIAVQDPEKPWVEGEVDDDTMDYIIAQMNKDIFKAIIAAKDRGITIF